MKFIAECASILSIVAFVFSIVVILVLLLKEFGILRFNLFFLKNRMEEQFPNQHSSNSTTEDASCLTSFDEAPLESNDPGIKESVHTFKIVENSQSIFIGMRLKRLLTCCQNENARLLYTITLLCLFSRLVVYLIGFMGIQLIHNENIGFISSFQAIWNKWDSDHYLFIAQNWYVTTGDKKFLIVFFPFYPMVIRYINVLVNNYFLSGVIVSNISLIISCFYLYKLINLDHDRNTSFNAVKYLLIFPVSFFLGAAFSESLFIALSIMTLYYARKENWFLCAVFGLLAAFTRSLGVLLIIPVFIEYMVSNKVLLLLAQKKFRQVFSSFVRQGIFAFFIPIGTLFYILINKLVTGSGFTFLEYQKNHWHQSFGLFYENIKNFIINAASWSPQDRASLWIPQVFIILSAILLVFYGFSRIRISYLIYMFVYLYVCISPTWLLSGPRYIMAIFPIYLLLALLSKNKVVDVLLTFVSLMSLCYCTLAFVAGRLIM